LDGTVTLSAYIWGPRYLDGEVFAWEQLLPRPMIGLSLTQPFSSLYLGAQFDPFPQFLDVSVGARVYSATELSGPAEGAPAQTDHDTNPVSPATRKVTSCAPFIALTASTDLFTGWLKSFAKN
jgi:hypothetical protein